MLYVLGFDTWKNTPVAEGTEFFENDNSGSTLELRNCAYTRFFISVYFIWFLLRDFSCEQALFFWSVIKWLIQNKKLLPFVSGYLYKKLPTL